MSEPIPETAGPTVLPPRYYHQHFLDFLARIQDSYAPVLTGRDEAFITRFHELDIDAQCLYVRMLNRRGRIFHGRRFRYQEIPDTAGAVTRLSQAGFVRPADESDFADWLDVITRTELLTVLESCCSTNRFRRSWKKGELSSFALANVDPLDASVTGAMTPYVIQNGLDTVSYLLFLYFGRKEDSLQRFTLKDLGLVTGAGFRRRFRPRFTERDVAINNWFYCRKLDQVTAAGQDAISGLASEAANWPPALDDDADRHRQQALYRLGEKAEQYRDTATAERVFTLADGWPASERRVRLVYSRGDRKAAEKLLAGMIDQPACEEELLFAQDFQARKFASKRTARVTDILRQGRVLEVDDCRRGEPEEAAADWYRARGAEAWFSENRLWKRMFGLLFWDLLFGSEHASLYNEFDRCPADLVNGSFYQRNHGLVERLLAGFADTGGLCRKLAATAAGAYGTPNGVFRWSNTMLAEIRACLTTVRPDGLETMMRRMAQDWTGNRSGYPDLMIIEHGKARFVEIKTEGDQLRRNQLKQITALEQAGIPVEVNRVRWTLDPMQVYAVVDIETTGRRGGSNRITEVGIVRVQGETIIDRWETLVNPGRRIPRRISGLTGITDDMVSGALLFSEIASIVKEKCRDAIFVAHNVQFDYGFISDEFQRLDRPFHAPTLCTVRGMRRWFPGLRSYSLGSLCNHFNIDLAHHHRALCDASAAARLLVLINRRRLGAD